ncbi:MAG: tripartite tricarboxylate transporter substrate-binding protein [Pseudomonadota bacterium]|nr:tripartite tricarboxylate transporter substrate-binding protein [Pseudomonadota bacterium]
MTMKPPVPGRAADCRSAAGSGADQLSREADSRDRAAPAGRPERHRAARRRRKSAGDLKQAIVIDNKPGATGNFGAAEAARAGPDGYTWLWTTDTMLTVKRNQTYADPSAARSRGHVEA